MSVSQGPAPTPECSECGHAIEAGVHVTDAMVERAFEAMACAGRPASRNVVRRALMAALQLAGFGAADMSDRVADQVAAVVPRVNSAPDDTAQRGGRPGRPPTLVDVRDEHGTVIWTSAA